MPSVHKYVGVWTHTHPHVYTHVLISQAALSESQAWLQCDAAGRGGSPRGFNGELEELEVVDRGGQQVGSGEHRAGAAVRAGLSGFVSPHSSEGKSKGAHTTHTNLPP